MYRKNNAPGALLHSEPNTASTAEATLATNYPSQAPLPAATTNPSIADLTAAATDSTTNANVTSSGKHAHSTPILRVPSKRIATATLSLRNTKQRKLSTDGAFKLDTSTTRPLTAAALSFRDLIASIFLVGKTPVRAFRDPAKCWPGACALEPMAPATKDRKSRFFPC